MRGKYEFNDRQVCINPDIVFESKEIRITVARAGNYWITGHRIRLDSAGCGDPCSVNIHNKITDKEEAIQKAVKDCIHYVNSNLCDQKSAPKFWKRSKSYLKKKI